MNNTFYFIILLFALLSCTENAIKSNKEPKKAILIETNNQIKTEKNLDQKENNDTIRINAPKWIIENYTNINEQNGWDYSFKLEKLTIIDSLNISYFIINHYDGGCERSVLYLYNDSIVIDSLSIMEVCDNGAERGYSYYKYNIESNFILIIKNGEIWNDESSYSIEEAYENEKIFNDYNNWVEKVDTIRYKMNKDKIIKLSATTI